MSRGEVPTAKASPRESNDSNKVVRNDRQSTLEVFKTLKSIPRRRRLTGLVAAIQVRVPRRPHWTAERSSVLECTPVLFGCRLSRTGSVLPRDLKPTGATSVVDRNVEINTSNRLQARRFLEQLSMRNIVHRREAEDMGALYT
jgi:hypothetical protein